MFHISGETTLLYMHDIFASHMVNGKLEETPCSKDLEGRFSLGNPPKRGSLTNLQWPSHHSQEKVFLDHMHPYAILIHIQSR